MLHMFDVHILFEIEQHFVQRHKFRFYSLVNDGVTDPYKSIVNDRYKQEHWIYSNAIFKMIFIDWIASKE